MLARVLKFVVAATLLGGSVIIAVRSPSVSITHVQRTDENPAKKEYSGRAAQLVEPAR